MKISNFLKLFPVLALMLMMNVPNALAGGTNRGENTDATPGEKATTTKEVTDPAHDRRKGTNNRTDTNNQTNKMKKPTTEDEMDSGTSGTGTGGSSTGGADSGTGTDSSGGRY